MDRILDLPLELAERCLVGDYLHPLLLTQLLLPGMLERGEGRLVNMLSEAAFTTPPAPAGAGGWGVAYAAAKAAFHRVTDMCHVEFAAQGICGLLHRPGPHPDRVHAGLGHGRGARGRRPRARPARGGGRGGRLAGRRPRRPAATPARWCRRASCARSSALVPGLAAAAARLSAPGPRQPHRVGERHQARGGDVGGAGGQHAVQLLEGLVAQRGVGRLGQLVGQLLDLAVQGATGVGGAPVGVQQARAGEPGRGARPTPPRSSRGCPAAPRPGSPWSRPPARAPPGR